MFCPNCGQTLEDNANFCLNCGTKTGGLTPQFPPPEPQQAQTYNQNYGAQQPPPPPPPSSYPNKQRKRPGCLIALLVFIGIISAVALSVYFLVPGFFKPHDLGIKTSEQAYASALQKLSLTKDKAPQKGVAEDYKYVYGAPKAVDTALSSEEITSFLNVNRPDYYALKNAQVKINPDNTIEAAAGLDVSYVFNNILQGRYNKDDAKKALPMLGLLPDNVNIYFKFGGEIKSNKVEQLSIHKASVMGIPIPESLVNSADAKKFVKDNIGGYIERTAARQTARYDSIKVDKGKLIFKGQVPSSLSRTPVK